MSITAKSEALKKGEPVPHYLIIGIQETIDLADYMVTEKMMTPFDEVGATILFGLKFIHDERQILKY